MKILIVGGGITGLSAAWFAKKRYPDAHITLLEKESRLGGWIRTARTEGFCFEVGPRTFPFGRCPNLLSLIEELKLPILVSASLKKYIYTDGKLRSFGSFLPKLLPYLIREAFIPASTQDDQTIYEFAARRFSPDIAETLFDPLTLGIYGGDIRKLSLKCCFPSLYHMEKQHRSLIRDLFSSPKSKKGLFTIKGGMQTLIDALEKHLNIEIVLNCNVDQIGDHQVIAQDAVWRADRVIAALPPPLPARSLWVVNLAFAGDILPKKGFGYLIPTKEKEALLGVVFDSHIFPEQNRGDVTCLSAMVRPEESEPIQAALQALQRHLHIQQTPIYTASFLARNAIPQFELGCTYPYGVSVDACIARGKCLLGNENV